jgi:hypothetical protein
LLSLGLFCSRTIEHILRGKPGQATYHHLTKPSALDLLCIVK